MAQHKGQQVLKHLVLSEAAQADDELAAAQSERQGRAVRVIRGWKCESRSDLHSEVGAALQFPPYYGENFDAMDECLHDLSWMPADSYLIVVLDVERVLPDDDAGLKSFLSCLSEAARVWDEPADPRFE